MLPRMTTSGFTVRRATEADLPAILAISNRAAAMTAANFAIEPEPLADWRAAFVATAASHPWLVAVDDAEGSVVGFAKASPWKGRCAYAHAAETTVYVAPEHHRRGIGRALYGRLIAQCDAIGFRALVGGITLPNEASVALHEAFGFRRIGCFERIGFKHGRWHDVGYWMRHHGEPDDPPAPPRSVDEVAAIG